MQGFQHEPGMKKPASSRRDAEHDYICLCQAVPVRQTELEHGTVAAGRRDEGTKRCIGAFGVVQCSIGCMLSAGRRSDTVGPPAVLGHSSLNSAAPHGAALFLPTPGGRVARIFSHGSQTGSTVRTISHSMVAGILTARRWAVSASLGSALMTQADSRLLRDCGINVIPGGLRVSASVPSGGDPAVRG